jgi:sec-independent protein translocase protein TatB
MEVPVFDLSLPKLLILAVLALVVFGPKELPKMAAQAGRVLRDLRRIAEGATADLREELGPEFADFDIDDLNPRRFVRKHLLSDLHATEPEPKPGPDNAEADGRPAATLIGGGAESIGAGAESAFDTEAT